MRQFGNGVKAVPAQQFIDPALGQRFEPGPQRRQGIGHQGFGEQPPHGKVIGIIAAQHDTLRCLVHRLVHHATAG